MRKNTQHTSHITQSHRAQAHTTNKHNTPCLALTFYPLHFGDAVCFVFKNIVFFLKKKVKKKYTKLLKPPFLDTFMRVIIADRNFMIIPLGKF